MVNSFGLVLALFSVCNTAFPSQAALALALVYALRFGLLLGFWKAGKKKERLGFFGGNIILHAWRCEGQA